MSNPKKILCIEDDLDIQVVLEFILTHAGFEPIIASYGKMGIKKAITMKPDLIVMDMMMPDISGLQAIKRIRANPNSQHIPIIVLSAHSTKKLKTEALTAGVEAYLDKSIIPTKLTEIIKAHLNLP